MKRTVARLAVYSLLLLAAAAQAQERVVTVWWAQWAPADALQELGNDFQKETGIAVKVHQIPWPSYQEQVFLNFGNKQTDFDIVVGDSQWIGRGATKGLYLELTDWLPTAVDLKTIHPRAAKYLCEYPPGSGKYFAAPCETDALGFVYRKDWFEDPANQAAFKAKHGRELKTPDTWAEFRNLAEFFHHPDQKRYGCSLLTGREYDSIVMGFQPFLWSWGGSWGDPATFAVKGYLNTPQAAEALQFLKDMLAFTPPGGSNADYFVNLEAFSNGSTAMVLDYFPFYPGIVASMGTQVGFFMMPGKDGKRAISLGGQGFSISTKTPAAQQDLAKQFIAWFQKPEVQQKWIAYPGSFTANTALLKSEAFAKAAPYNPTFAASLDYLQDFWNVPAYNELLGKAVLYLGEALDGVKTPQAALDQLAEEHELIMQQAGLLK